MSKKAEAKNNLIKVAELYDHKYTRNQMICYLQLYSEIKCYFSWGTVKDYSISIDSIKKILEDYLSKYERYFLEEFLGLKTGKPKNFKEIQKELDLPYVAVRSSTYNAVRKIQDVIVMNYISRDLNEELKPLNPRLNIFDLPVAIKNALVRLRLDIEEVQKMGARELQQNRCIGEATIGTIRNYFSAKGIKW